MTAFAIDELNRHPVYRRLELVRDLYREYILFRWPEWMPGTKVLARRLDKALYLWGARIEHRIWTRRQKEYHEERTRMRQEALDRQFEEMVRESSRTKREVDRLMANT